MKITTLSSGSTGNSYVLADSTGSQLLLECGIKYEKIVPHIDFEKLEAVLISHSHQDHSMSKSKFSDFYTIVSPETHIAKSVLCFQNWLVCPIECSHNVDCFGYIIRNKIEKKNILFCTDTSNLPRVVDHHFDCMMLECNYSYDKMLDNSQANKLTSDGYKNHLALELLVDWLRLRECKPTHLMAIHLSNNGNLDKDLAEQQLKQFATHFCFAQKGGTVEI